MSRDGYRNVYAVDEGLGGEATAMYVPGQIKRGDHDRGGSPFARDYDRIMSLVAELRSGRGEEKARKINETLDFVVSKIEKTERGQVGGFAFASSQDAQRVIDVLNNMLEPMLADLPSSLGKSLDRILVHSIVRLEVLRDRAVYEDVGPTKQFHPDDVGKDVDAVAQSGGPESTGPLPREVSLNEKQLEKEVDRLVQRIDGATSLDERGLDLLEKNIKVCVAEAIGVIRSKGYNEDTMRQSATNLKRAVESKKDVFGSAWTNQVTDDIKVEWLASL